MSDPSKTNDPTQQTSGVTGSGTTSPIGAALPPKWKTLYEEEKTLINSNRPAALKLNAERVAEQVKYLKEWMLGPTKEEIEELPQADVQKAREWLKRQQTDYQRKRQELGTDLQIARDKVQEKQDALKVKADSLKELFEIKKGLAKQKEDVEKETKSLEEKAEAAQEEWRKQLIQAELQAVNAKKESIENAKKPLLGAIEAAYVAWSDAHEALRKEAVDGLEAKEIEIKQLDKELEYLKLHENVLIKWRIEQQPKQGG